jgi:uncharacterized protein
VLYLDANIFIFAALNTGVEGEQASELLTRIQQGQEEAVTSALTFDEVFWEVKKNRGIEKAIDTAGAMLNFPNLQIAAADKEVDYLALQLIKKYNLAPRDAIHASTAITFKVNCIVTTDPDFFKIKELKTRGL